MDNKTDDIYEFSAEQLAVVNEGLRQLDNGEFLTNEEANKMVDEWLKRNSEGRNN